MKDLFICPTCDEMTEFEGAAPDESVASRVIACKCGKRYVIAVNYGCRVLALKQLEDAS